MREAASVQWDLRSSIELAGLFDAVQGQGKHVMWSCVGALLWALWLIRNKLASEGIFPSHPANAIFRCSLLLRHWSPLVRQKDAEMMKNTQDRLHQVYVMAREPAATS